jgi:hypothetical protein
MKIAIFVLYDVSKAAEIAKVGDQVQKMPGRKVLANYLFQGKPFDGLPPNTAVNMTISEFESNEAMLAVQYPLGLAGATSWAVPVFEGPVAGSVETEKKFRK